MNAYFFILTILISTLAVAQNQYIFEGIDQRGNHCELKLREIGSNRFPGSKLGIHFTSTKRKVFYPVFLELVAGQVTENTSLVYKSGNVEQRSIWEIYSSPIPLPRAITGEKKISVAIELDKSSNPMWYKYHIGFFPVIERVFCSGLRAVQ